MGRQYVIENTRERKRLRALVSRITDEELSLPYYKEGWTVAAGLAHLAFWDERRPRWGEEIYWWVTLHSTYPTY